MALLPPLSTPGLKFTEVGTTHTGKLIEISQPEQSREYSPDGPGDLAFWDRERTRPKMQVRFTLECAPDPTVAGDDGRRTIYAVVSGKPGGMYAVLNKALEKATSLGGQLTIRFTGTDPESKNPANPRKLYEASYVEPSLAEQMGGQQPDHEAQGAPTPQAATPPAADTIPAPWTAEQWGAFTDEQRAAILGTQPAA